jgi:hypothetical protein
MPGMPNSGIVPRAHSMFKRWILSIEYDKTMDFLVMPVDADSVQFY